MTLWVEMTGRWMSLQHRLNSKLNQDENEKQGEIKNEKGKPQRPFCTRFFRE